MVRVLVAAAMLATAIVLLLVPFHPEAAFLALLYRVTPGTSFARGLDWFVVETGGNVLLFALVGAAAFVITRRPRLAVLLGWIISAVAETSQLLIPHRVASWTDFVTNCVGTAIGVLLAVLVRRGWMRSRRPLSA